MLRFLLNFPFLFSFPPFLFIVRSRRLKDTRPCTSLKRILTDEVDGNSLATETGSLDDAVSNLRFLEQAKPKSNNLARSACPLYPADSLYLFYCRSGCADFCIDSMMEWLYGDSDESHTNSPQGFYAAAALP